MKRLVLSVALISLLTGTVIAGDIPSGGIAPPPPPPPDGMQATGTSAPGDIPSGGVTYQIADTTIDLIQMLLGVGM